MIWTKEQLRQPVWDTNVVYGESITMVRDDNGAAAAPLLFDPIHILEVSNAGGTEIYEEGRDWVFEDGLLKLTERSRIFAFTKDELYPAEGVPGQSFALPEGYLLFHEGSFFIDRQIIVTYTCKRDGWKGVRPVPAKEQLPRTFELLHGKKPMSVVLYGDSISARANATELMCIPPYQPDWGKLLIQHLTDHYGVEIDFHNTAVGGMDAVWARDNAKERVAAHKPDLAIIAFGMNDIGKEPP